jgi:hypothetical protein
LTVITEGSREKNKTGGGFLALKREKQKDAVYDACGSKFFVNRKTAG